MKLFSFLSYLTKFVEKNAQKDEHDANFLISTNDL